MHWRLKTSVCNIIYIYSIFPAFFGKTNNILDGQGVIFVDNSHHFTDQSLVGSTATNTRIDTKPVIVPKLQKYVSMITTDIVGEIRFSWNVMYVRMSCMYKLYILQYTYMYVYCICNIVM